MSFSLDKNNKKKELWEKDKTKWQIFKINATIAWRRFDTQTKGMGMFFVMIFGIMLVITSLPLISEVIMKQFQLQKFKTALETACPTMEFYSRNYKDCEEIGVRP